MRKIKDNERIYEKQVLDQALGNSDINPLSWPDFEVDIPEDSGRPWYKDEIINHREKIHPQLTHIIENRLIEGKNPDSFEQVREDYITWWYNNQNRNNPLSMSTDLNGLVNFYDKNPNFLGDDKEKKLLRLKNLSSLVVPKDAEDLEDIIKIIRKESGVHMKDIFNDDSMDDQSYIYSNLNLNTNSMKGFSKSRPDFGTYGEDNVLLLFSNNHLFTYVDGKLKSAIKSNDNLITMTNPSEYISEKTFGVFDTRLRKKLVSPYLNLMERLAEDSDNQSDNILDSEWYNIHSILDNITAGNAPLKSTRNRLWKENEFKEYFANTGNEKLFKRFIGLYGTQEEATKELLYRGWKEGLIPDPLSALERGQEMEYKKDREVDLYI
ncbi:MAG: hypothetical protein VW079_01005 [Candidatus Woesearchaeota archaeon]